MSELLIATVGSSNSNGVTLIFPGQTNATTKYYKKVLTNHALSVGDKVLVAKLSGTYVVIGAVNYS